MWHEARKHERKLRGMMVDYKKRAERRREYYEKIKKDPAQFLQVHGRACKIHLDSAVALAAESPVNMMPWQGDTNNMIDRFDVRAHLDHIPSYSPALLNPISPEQESDERKCNYERYRGLVQNDFAGISEEQCLYQIYMDELYGGLPKPNEEEKKKLAEKKASIGYTYEDSTVAELENSAEKAREEEDSEEENSNTDEDEVIPDIDVEVDVDELNQEQVADLNKQATTYGMAEGDFVRMLRKDKEEAEAIKNAKALEEEKAMYSLLPAGPTFPAPEEGIPGEALERPEDQSPQLRPPRQPHLRPLQTLPLGIQLGIALPVPDAIAGPRGEDHLHHQLRRQRRGGRVRAGRRHSRERARSRQSPRGAGAAGARPWRLVPAPLLVLLHVPVLVLLVQLPLELPLAPRGGLAPLRPLRPLPRAPLFPLPLPLPPLFRRGVPGRAPPLQVLLPGAGPSLRLPAPVQEPLAVRGALPAPAPLEQQPEQPEPQRLPQPQQIPVSGAGQGSAPHSIARRGGEAEKPKLTPQEKLRLRMQKALNRQFKADKKAAQEKMLQQEHERQEREDELRAMARKIRMKERERREKEREEWERQYSRQSRSPSPRYSREYSSSRRRSRSRSRSPHYRH
ncbi:CLK4-associating serine/arginine rich protein isoform X4 [Lathamus discolor]|uniref:CLK4-associating serine/arginine rich protein isoform X4 n=1 Tax=Lathamus discolor TaxID=678569 RepID=UPI0032B86315